MFVGPEEDGLRPILRQESFAPDAVKQAIEYVAKEGLLVKIFHEMPDGELGVSWCGDFVRSTSTLLIQATVRRDVKKTKLMMPKNTSLDTCHSINDHTVPCTSSL